MIQASHCERPTHYCLSGGNSFSPSETRTGDADLAGARWRKSFLNGAITGNAAFVSLWQIERCAA
jgi:hypothetical protein